VAVLVLVASLGCGEARGGASSKGADLYKSQACVTCHGADGAGTVFGPPLRGLRAHWTKETLGEYLKDPLGYAAKDPRLSAQAKTYTLPMQRFDKLPPEDLAAIAEHVLAMP
jgi:mono/diheme cytochrome c family protein